MGEKIKIEHMKANITSKQILMRKLTQHTKKQKINEV